MREHAYRDNTTRSTERKRERKRERGGQKTNEKGGKKAERERGGERGKKESFCNAPPLNRSFAIPREKGEEERKPAKEEGAEREEKFRGRNDRRP